MKSFLLDYLAENSDHVGISTLLQSGIGFLINRVPLWHKGVANVLPVSTVK
jgi:hypothetical protein